MTRALVRLPSYNTFYTRSTFVTTNLLLARALEYAVKMPPKRPSPSDELSGRERKKQKTAIARTIAVQSEARTSTPSAVNAEAGPSKSVRFDSESRSIDREGYCSVTLYEGMKGLPGAMDVEKFAEVRIFQPGVTLESNTYIG